MRFDAQSLNSGQTGMPVFFLPPHGAGGVEYYGFRHLFEAVQAPLFGFDEIYGPQDALEDWADGLFREILKVSAGRGCRLLAWGHGAGLAVLVGERLYQAKIPVSALLLDPIPPHGYDRWDRVKSFLRLHLTGLLQIALEWSRWARGLCTTQHLLECSAAYLLHGYWLPARLKAQQWTRHHLGSSHIYSARSAFRAGTAQFVPRPCSLDACLLLSSNRGQRQRQWRPYWSGRLEVCALQRNCHDFSQQALSEISDWLNRLPQ